MCLTESQSSLSWPSHLFCPVHILGFASSTLSNFQEFLTSSGPMITYSPTFNFSYTYILFNDLFYMSLRGVESRWEETYVLSSLDAAPFSTTFLPLSSLALSWNYRKGFQIPGMASKTFLYNQPSVSMGFASTNSTNCGSKKKKKSYFIADV